MLAGRLIEGGFQTIRRWSGIAEALPALLAAPPEILLISRLSSRHFPEGEMLSLKQRTRLVLVVDRRDMMTAGDLPAIGVDAILASNASAASIAECLTFVRAGRAWLDAGLFQQLFQRDSARSWTSLSLRERQVAQLAAQGLSNKRIARALQLSDGTVKIHMHHVLSKLGVNGREALAARLPEALLDTAATNPPGEVAATQDIYPAA